MVFILQYLTFSLPVPLKRRKFTRAGVNELRLHHTKTAACICDIISNAPTLTDAIFCMYYIVNFIIYSNIYHFDTSDQREKPVYISYIAHNAYLSVRYKKYCTLNLVKTFQSIIRFLFMKHVIYLNLL